jgi:hypothetical protein
MIDATTHTRKIWRSHFDGADSTTIVVFCRIGMLHSTWVSVNFGHNQIL